MAILALDQGQTKTNALLLAENGEILGIGMAGGASHYKDCLLYTSVKDTGYGGYGNSGKLRNFINGNFFLLIRHKETPL